MVPNFPHRTIAVLTTLGDGPHAIPVSAPVRLTDDRIGLSLHRTRDSLARLRAEPRVALTILTERNVAFTARGRARVIEEPMEVAPEYAAVAIDVDHVDDHRSAAFTVSGGVSREWVEEGEKRALGTRAAALRDLAGPVGVVA